MRLLPTSLQALVQELSKLPGVGERTALRYAVTLIKEGSRRMEPMQKALAMVSTEVTTCPKCHFWSQSGHCPLCEDVNRHAHRLCIVRDCPDVLALEKFKAHPWKYHVLQGLLSPLSGIGPGQIRLESLFRRLDHEAIEEVILAVDSTVEGDATSLYVRDFLREHFPKISMTRTALGLPAGASVEYLDPSTLEKALLNRVPYE